MSWKVEGRLRVLQEDLIDWLSDWNETADMMLADDEPLNDQSFSYLENITEIIVALAANNN